jgi:hypothetical protein
MDIFIGIIISDASVSRQGYGDARLQFKQGYNNFFYFYFVFFNLSHYCAKLPYTTRTGIGKNVHTGLGFTTRSLPCITLLYNMFYVNKVKVIPSNLYDLLS